MKENKKLNTLMLRELLLHLISKAYENYPKEEQTNPLLPKRPTPELTFVPMQSIPTHLVQRMLAHNLGTQIDRLQLDYAFLFQCYDILEALGLCQKRMESKVEAKPENGWIALSFGAVNELGVPQKWSKHFKFVKELAVAGDPIKE